MLPKPMHSVVLFIFFIHRDLSNLLLIDIPVKEMSIIQYYIENLFGILYNYYYFLLKKIYTYVLSRTIP